MKVTKNMPYDFTQEPIGMGQMMKGNITPNRGFCGF